MSPVIPLAPAAVAPDLLEVQRSRRRGTEARAATVTVSLIDQRFYRVEQVSGPLEVAESSWFRDELLCETAAAGWRLERQEPLPGGFLQLCFVPRSRLRRSGRR